MDGAVLTRRGTSEEWTRLRDRVSAGRYGVTVTFQYPDGLRTLVAQNRIAAFDLARGRWGDGWRGEPCVSSPWSIYCDVTGRTRAKHGTEHHTNKRSAPSRVAQRRAWREGK
jgi:hypothetical protein